ncbi:CBS domain pair protein [Streptomyces himastatinicus ATCC 53653]|uniref:CBS domain pair protein n=1 Tax=Streptomyces himastatinicus ATCC 53653 TaxID=457427 RepID=D9WHX2_9ACTN|nr:CBS domain pair protein [Streptomyces himastatinicus ATCC 53653]
MGEKVVAGEFDPSGRQRQRGRLRQCLDALSRLLADKRFDRPKNLMGLEIELNLAGADGLPRMMNTEVLERIASHDFQTELGQCNLEVNIVPHRLHGRVLDQLSEELRTGLSYADRKAREVSSEIVMIGILPTLATRDLGSANLSYDDRYKLLNEQMLAARGEDFLIDIEGRERISYASASIAPEAACTSVQLHLQVTPGRFAAVWNAAQAVAAVQIAIGANSPFVFGREVWRESRPPLFLQATDVRAPEYATQGVRPRTWFGERWITDAYQLFEENLRYFPPLLSDDADDVVFVPVLHRERDENHTLLTALATAHTHGVHVDWTPCRICVWRTGCCPRAPRSPMSSPTPPSTTGWSGRSPRSPVRCGPGCRSAPPRPTSTPRAATASTRSCNGRSPAVPPPWRAPPPYGWSSRSCCRWPPPDWTRGASSPPTATATSG